MITIRPANLADAQAIQAIYAPYVEKTAITFEYEVPSVQEFEKRISNTIERYPYLVAEEDGQVLGYAYASTYYARTAYDWTTELSIYLNEDARGRGLGSQLYGALEEELEKRKAETTLPPLYSRGVLGKYAHIVSSASRGAVTDFWNTDKSGKK